MGLHIVNRVGIQTEAFMSKWITSCLVCILFASTGCKIEPVKLYPGPKLESSQLALIHDVGPDRSQLPGYQNKRSAGIQAIKGTGLTAAWARAS